MVDESTRATRLLIASRFVRSIAQGAFVVDFALYLKALHWSAVGISAVLAAALLVGVATTLLAGPLSDRGGRRWFLFGYEASQVAAGLAALLSAQPVVLVAAALVGGYGRGGNGAAGPFGPVEQAWLAQSVPAQRRGTVYSLNSALGFVGNALGALVAAAPARLQVWLPGALAYRPLFLLAAVGSMVCCVLILRTPDREMAEPTAGKTERLREEAGAARVTRRENGLILRLMIANMMNGAGIGATGPLIAYWFAVKFGQGPASIGPLMGVAFLAAAAASLLTGWLSSWLGVVRAVVAMRVVGLALLIALPFAPHFWLAASLYVLRGMFNRGTAGARSALNVSLVRPHRRGFAASMANVSMQVPRSISPLLTGVLFAAGDLTLPFLIGAAFQTGYVVFYYLSFGGVDPSVERNSG